jgi:hypothetical protein
MKVLCFEGITEKRLLLRKLKIYSIKILAQKLINFESFDFFDNSHRVVCGSYFARNLVD